jgi:regulator of protease activity HflC (stomatin/prohibitin superfamily)
MTILIGLLAVLVVLTLIGGSTGVRIINEYERGVVFRLGRLTNLKGAGFRLIVPFGIDRLVKVDLRTVTLEVPPQEAITLDNVTVKVLAVIYFQVVNPQDAITKVQNYYNATSQIAQSTLRSVLGQSSMHDLLADRSKLGATLQRIIDEHTEPWGVKVSSVEIKDVELPQSMQRAMARQAEAERERQAKIIHAQGEFDSATKLTEAAALISTQPSALQLRYLQTLSEIGAEQNSVIVFPMPMDIIKPFLDLTGKAMRDDGPTPPAPTPELPRPYVTRASVLEKQDHAAEG